MFLSYGLPDRREDILTWLTSTFAAPYSIVLAEKPCYILQHSFCDLLGLEVRDCPGHRLYGFSFLFVLWIASFECVDVDMIRKSEGGRTGRWHGCRGRGGAWVCVAVKNTLWPLTIQDVGHAPEVIGRCPKCGPVFSVALYL